MLLGCLLNAVLLEGSSVGIRGIQTKGFAARTDAFINGFPAINLECSPNAYILKLRSIHQGMPSPSITGELHTTGDWPRLTVSYTQPTLPVSVHFRDPRYIVVVVWSETHSDITALKTHRVTVDPISFGLTTTWTLTTSLKHLAARVHDLVWRKDHGITGAMTPSEIEKHGQPPRTSHVHPRDTGSLPISIDVWVYDTAFNNIVIDKGPQKTPDRSWIEPLDSGAEQTVQRLGGVSATGKHIATHTIS